MKRTSILVFILSACFVFVAWGQQPAGQCLNNWSEFHRTNMKRWNPCEKVLNVKNVGSLQKLWSYSGGGMYSAPAVANGVVYVGSVDNIVSNVYALDASTGATLWRYPTDYYVESSPAVANGVVHVGSYDNNVYAFGRKKGRE